MEMMLADERRSVRRDVEVECQVVRAQGGEVLAERAVDLSIDGMLVLSSAACVLGESMLATFRLPGTASWLTVPARVARVIAGRRHNDPGRAIALEFEVLDVEVQRSLRAALEMLPEPPPGRARRVDYAATAGLIALDEEAVLQSL
jgi:hypothetical protein